MAKRKRATQLYIRDFAPAQRGETEYARKYSGLIRQIDEMTRLGSGDTLDVTDQRSLGDNEVEFRESLRRIQQAELYLLLNGRLYHPVELSSLEWRNG